MQAEWDYCFFLFFSSFSKTNIKKKRQEFHFLKYRKTVDRTKEEKKAANKHLGARVCFGRGNNFNNNNSNKKKKKKETLSTSLVFSYLIIKQRTSGCFNTPVYKSEWEKEIYRKIYITTNFVKKLIDSEFRFIHSICFQISLTNWYFHRRCGVRWIHREKCNDKFVCTHHNRCILQIKSEWIEAMVNEEFLLESVGWDVWVNRDIDQWYSLRDRQFLTFVKTCDISFLSLLILFEQLHEDNIMSWHMISNRQQQQDKRGNCINLVHQGNDYDAYLIAVIALWLVHRWQNEQSFPTLRHTTQKHLEYDKRTSYWNRSRGWYTFIKTSKTILTVNISNQIKCTNFSKECNDSFEYIQSFDLYSCSIWRRVLINHNGFVSVDIATPWARNVSVDHSLSVRGRTTCSCCSNNMN